MTLTADEYLEQAKSTAIYPGAGTGSVGALAYVTMGFLGEVGEISNKLKKILRDRDGVLGEEDKKNLAPEYGDVLWYVAMLANEVSTKLTDERGVSLDDPYESGDAGIGSFEFEIRFLDEYESLCLATFELALIVSDLSAPVGGRVSSVGLNETPYDGTLSEFGKIAVAKAVPLLGFVADILDTTLTEIGQSNLEKLQSRKARGTIGGAGDNR